MSDLIERQAAIDLINDIDLINFTAKGVIRGRLQKLPSAQPEIKCIAKVTLTDEQVKEAFEKAKNEILAVLPPERKTGHWVEKGVNADKTHNIVCSECGEGYKTRGHAKSIATKAKWRFCPHCGVRMEEQK